MKHRVINDEEGRHVFLEILSDTLEAWTFEFLLQNGYESETHRTLAKQDLNLDTLFKSSTRTLIQIGLPEVNENLFVVKFSKPEQFYYYDVSLKIGTLSYPAIYPVDATGLPILDSYLNRSGFSWKGSDSFLAMAYPEQFTMADPPMADMKPLAPQALADTVFVFTDTTTFRESTFYVVRKDSLASLGTTMLKAPPYFPQYRQLGELIESMLYLLSEQERKAMIKSRNPKQAFDSFWMNTFSTKSRARNAIRSYYKKVERSNALFTDFRPGWKTDRGMMLIIYGLPEEVYRTGNLEEWYYDNGDAFEFTIISTFFAPKTYALRRNRSFEERWYTKIAALRRSMNE